MKSLRIAMIGQRGVPATFGGIERHVEEIGSRLAARGHEVTVFCRTNYVENRPAEYRGMRLRYLPTIGTKHLDAIVHSSVSTIAAMAERLDVIHYHALGPGLLAPLPRLASSAGVVLTVHGLDHKRAKWRGAARAVLGLGAWLSARAPHATIVVSRDLVGHYAANGRDADYIPNGVTAPGALRVSVRDRLGLDGHPYLLFVGRMVPEKAPDLLVRAFGRMPGDLRLVLVGDSSFTGSYVEALTRLAAVDRRVTMAGYIFDDALQDLYANATAFVLPSALEGLPLTLLEAASHGTPIVASDIPPHVEVVGGEGPGRRLFRSGDEDDLVRVLDRALADGSAGARGALELRDRVLRTYRWDDAAASTERVYRRVVAINRRNAVASRSAADTTARVPAGRVMEG